MYVHSVATRNCIESVGSADHYVDKERVSKMLCYIYICYNITNNDDDDDGHCSEDEGDNDDNDADDGL